MAADKGLDQLFALARTLAGSKVDRARVEEDAGAIPFVREASAVFGGEAGVDYVELWLVDESGITVADLEARLGEAKSVPRVHAGDPAQVAFGLDDPALPFTCRLYADLDEHGRVRTMTLRRDERL